MTGIARYAAAILCAAIVASLFGAGSAGAAELVLNGGFETGGFTDGWVDGAGSVMGPLNPNWADHLVSLDMPATGNYSALLGFKYTEPQQHRYGFMHYDVTIPAGVSSATLAFAYRQQGYDGVGRDPFEVEIRDTSGNTLATVLSFAFPERTGVFKDSGWLREGFDMSPFAGQTVRIYFRQVNSDDNWYETWVFVDDVSLETTGWVDLVVDGDGDDLFGAPGTGDGGTSLESTEAGLAVSYALEIENEGPAGDAFVLSGSPPAGWSLVLRYGGADYTLPWTTPLLPAGTSIAAEVIVSVPPGEAIGAYLTVIDAVSVSDSDHYDSVTLGTNVVPAPYQPDLVIDGDGRGVIDTDGAEGGSSALAAPPDTTVEFTVELVNFGTDDDSFLIWWTSDAPITAVVDDGGAAHAGPFTTPIIPPGASLFFTLRVTVPVSVTGGLYETLLYAQSVSDDLEQDGVTAAVTVLAPAVDMIISGSGDDIIDPTGRGLGGSATAVGVPGQTVLFPIVIQNEGTVSDSFTLTWTRPANRWTARITDGVNGYALPWTTPVMSPGKSRTYYLAVTISDRAGYTSYLSLLEAESSVDGTVRESVSAIVIVGSANEIDLMIDGDGDDIYGPLGTGLGGFSSLAAAPGETLFLAITLENESGTDLFDLSWAAPPGWEVLIGDSTSTMRGVPSGVYLLEVRVPVGCPEGTFDIILDGRKVDKSYLVDSVRGSVTVAASGQLQLVKEVDLAAAQPGDVITYTIIFSNPGSEDVREIEISDVLPAEVDIVTDAFGPGRDIKWTAGAVTTYLTADPTDPDEALYTAATRSLTVVLSRRAPFTLGPGEEGRIIYRARIR